MCQYVYTCLLHCTASCILIALKVGRFRTKLHLEETNAESLELSVMFDMYFLCNRLCHKVKENKVAFRISHLISFIVVKCRFFFKKKKNTFFLMISIFLVFSWIISDHKYFFPLYSPLTILYVIVISLRTMEIKYSE